MKLRPQAESLSGLPQPNFVGYASAPILAKRAPTVTDTGYPLGQLWVDKVAGADYVLVNVLAGVANWVLQGTDTGPLNTLTGDSGGAISPSAGNINLLGTASEITTTGAGSTITFSLPATMIVPGSLEVVGALLADSTLTSLGATALATTGASVNTFGNATGATSVTVTSGSGGITLTATNAALTANSGTGALNISTDAAATTVHVATGAGAKTAVFGSTNSTSATTVQSGSGALNVTSTNGAMTLASGTGEIDISADAATTTVKLGTGAGAKTVSVGSTNSTSATTVQSGSGALNVTATNGAITVASGTGEIDISADAAATTVKLATGAGVKALTLGSTDTTSITTIQSGSGGIVVNPPNGNISVSPGLISGNSSPQVLSDRLGSVTFTGFTTAPAATETFVITNTIVSATSAMFVTVCNEGTNDAQMTISQVKRGAGTFSVLCKNNGAAALNGDVTITFWVLN